MEKKKRKNPFSRCFLRDHRLDITQKKRKKEKRQGRSRAPHTRFLGPVAKKKKKKENGRPAQDQDRNPPLESKRERGKTDIANRLARPLFLKKNEG